MRWFCFVKRKRAYDMRMSDWSSDVCSADLVEALSLFDIVWLREADRLPDAAFTALIEAVAERGCGLLCKASLAAVDRLAAAVPPALRVDRTSTRLKSSH